MQKIGLLVPRNPLQKEPPMPTPNRVSVTARSRAALIGAAFLLVVTACASPEGPAPSASTSAPPSNIPSSLQPIALPSAVPSAFRPGGTAVHRPCETLLDTAAVAATFAASTYEYVGTSDPLLAIVGGIQCDYFFGHVEDDPDDDQDAVGDQVYVAVAPAIIATPSAVEASLMANSCGSDPVDSDVSGPGCRTTATYNGWWYSLSVYGVSTAVVQHESLEAIRTMLEASLALSVAPTVVEGANRFDCASVKTDGKAPGQTRIMPNQRKGAEIFAAAFLLVGPTTCEFTIRKSQLWDLTVYPGGAIGLNQCKYTAGIYNPDHGSVTINGVQEAYTLVNTDTAEMCASDGTNLIHVVAYDYDYALEDYDVAAIGGLLVPVFEALKEASSR
jgi:hypothetical protein